MPDKQKVTFYLSDELHRQFKIRAAVDGETMSSMAQRAIKFYMNNAELVESADQVHGRAYQVHSCPECNVAVTLQKDGLAPVASHGTQVVDELAALSAISGLSCDNSPEQRSLKSGGLESKNLESGSSKPKSPDEGELITA